MLTSPLLVYLASGCIGALSRWADPRALRGELYAFAVSPVGLVQQLDDVDDAAPEAVAAQARLKLCHAQRVFVSHIPTLTLRANPQAPFAARDTPVEARNGAFVDEGFP